MFKLTPWYLIVPPWLWYTLLFGSAAAYYICLLRLIIALRRHSGRKHCLRLLGQGFVFWLLRYLTYTCKIVSWHHLGG